MSELHDSIRLILEDYIVETENDWETDLERMTNRILKLIEIERGMKNEEIFGY